MLYAGALVAVFGDEVLVEKAERLLGGRGGQADEVRVEIVEDLTPDVVNGTVTFVGDDEIKGLDGNVGIVGDVARFLVPHVEVEQGAFFEVVLELGFAAQHGVKTLNGGDANAARLVERVGGEMLDVEEFGKETPIVRRAVLLKFAEGFASEIVAVYEKEDATSVGKLDEAIDGTDGGKGLAAACCHLNEGAGAVLGQGNFQILDRFDLANAQIGFIERRQIAQALADGILLLEPVGERFGTMKGKNGTLARVGVAQVGELRFGTGAFVAKGKRELDLRQIGGGGGLVFFGLQMQHCERCGNVLCALVAPSGQDTYVCLEHANVARVRHFGEIGAILARAFGCVNGLCSYPIDRALKKQGNQSCDSNQHLVAHAHSISFSINPLPRTFDSCTCTFCLDTRAREI